MNGGCKELMNLLTKDTRSIVRNLAAILKLAIMGLANLVGIKEF